MQRREGKGLQHVAPAANEDNFLGKGLRPRAAFSGRAWEGGGHQASESSCQSPRDLLPVLFARVRLLGRGACDLVSRGAQVHRTWIPTAHSHCCHTWHSWWPMHKCLRRHSCWNWHCYYYYYYSQCLANREERGERREREGGGGGSQAFGSPSPHLKGPHRSEGGNQKRKSALCNHQLSKSPRAGNKERRSVLCNHRLSKSPRVGGKERKNALWNQLCSKSPRVGKEAP